MVEKISIQIALEGTEEIKRQLAGVSEAGQKAFADISAAAAKAGGFDKLDPTLVTRKLSEFGVTATTEIGKITTALETAGKTEVMVSGIQKLEQGMGRLSTATQKATEIFGLNRREVQAIEKAFREIDLGPIGSQFGLLGRVGAAFGPTALGITAIGAAVTGVTASLIKFTTSAEETEKALTELQKVSGASFENLSALQIVFAQGGTSAKQFSSEFGNLSQAIQQADVTRYTRQWADWDKGFTAFVNNVDNLRSKFNNLASGAAQTFSPLATFQNRLEALKESLAEVKTPEEQYHRLADIFRTLSREGAAGVAEVQRLGKALGLSPETIESYTLGSQKMREMEAEARQLGLVQTESEKQALREMTAGWNQLSTLVGAAFQKIGAAAAPEFAKLLEDVKKVLADIVHDFQTLPLDQAMAGLGDKLAPAFDAIMGTLSPILIRIGNALGTAFVQGIWDGIQSAASSILNWDWLTQQFSLFAESVKRNFEILKRDLESTFGGSSSGETGSAGGGGGGGGFAAGGLIGGRGSGTSDSNFAWVSRGEHIMPARAVAQPGVLAFLEALRRSGGNLARVLDGMSRFALGGPALRPIPAFADGGLVGMSHVTIQFPGVAAISGLRASSDTIDELRKASALAQVRSGGRKPSRYF
jgi:hypothetical protein